MKKVDCKSPTTKTPITEELEILDPLDQNSWFVLQPIHGIKPEQHTLPNHPGWWVNTFLSGINAESALEVIQDDQGNLVILEYGPEPTPIKDLCTEVRNLTCGMTGNKIPHPNPWFGPMDKIERLPAKPTLTQ